MRIYCEICNIIAYITIAEKESPHMSDLPKSHRPADGTLPEPVFFPAGTRPVKKGQRLDWNWVARQVARGVHLEEIARSQGVPVERIERNFERSDRFLDRIEYERKRLADDAAARFERLALQVSDGISRIAAEGDAKVLLWLAERFNLGRRPIKWPPPPDPTRTEEGRRQLRQSFLSIVDVIRAEKELDAAKRQQASSQVKR
jgi:hypothetical protein